MKIKVCGMRNPKNIKEIARLKPDFMGFIFYPPSPRFLASEEGFPFDSLKGICTAGVFVNATDSEIVNTIRRFKLKAIQLHGQESEAFCRNIRQLGVKVLKAVAVADKSDLENLDRFAGAVDYLVFDTKTQQHGGSGTKFNWELLNEYQAGIPFLLGGGIEEQDAERLAKLNHTMLAGVDINSRFETEPGMKDAEKVSRFVNKLRAI